MENGPLTPGLEDGTIDVERLLVEPQDGHVSMDSIICFDKKNSENVMDMEEASRSLGPLNNSIAEERKYMLNEKVHDTIPTEDEVGYFRRQSDLCSMGEEYLLGVEFSESITNLDYGSSEHLHTSISDRPILASCTRMGSPWKSDLFRVMDETDCQRHQPGVSRLDSGDTSSGRECDILAIEKKSPTSCALHNFGKIDDFTSCSFQEVLSGENNGSLSTSEEMLCSPKTEKNDGFELNGKDSETNRFGGQDELATISAQENCSDAFRTQKRSRKPTQRYIDEVVDPISRYSKKRREVSSSTLKDKPVGVKDYKKRNVGSKAMKLPVEESSVIAIQVPFGSLVNNEHPKNHTNDAVHGAENANLMTKQKGACVTPENQKQRDDFATSFHLKKRIDCLTTIQKKRYESDGDGTGAHSKKKNDRLTSSSPKNDRLTSSSPKNDRLTSSSPKKKDDGAIVLTQKKRDHRVTAVRQKKKDDYFKEAEHKKSDDRLIEQNPEEISGRRKHHRLWTIAEVRKLIDGVSQYGVGRWSRIKKLFFSSSPHRTSVDLKDKWRNLLKASGILEPSNRQGEKKRNPAWRPLPKSILRRVCELAAMYPYPKGQNPKTGRNSLDSPDRSTDITLSDYRSILRSISSN